MVLISRFREKVWFVIQKVDYRPTDYCVSVKSCPFVDCEYDIGQDLLDIWYNLIRAYIG